MVRCMTKSFHAPTENHADAMAQREAKALSDLHRAEPEGEGPAPADLCKTIAIFGGALAGVAVLALLLLWRIGGAESVMLALGLLPAYLLIGGATAVLGVRQRLKDEARLRGIAHRRASDEVVKA